MPKHEYEVRITNTEVRSVFVEADDWEEAERLAEEKFYSDRDSCEVRSESLDVEVSWSDEDY